MAFISFDCFAGGKTGGDYGEMTYARWVQNASDILDYAVLQPFCDAGNIGVVGLSCGSTVGLRLALQDKRIKYVDCIATCLTVHIGMSGGGAAKCFVDNFDALLAGERCNLFGVDFNKEFFIDDISNAPVHALHEGSITCPVLFQQGLLDNAYRISDARLGYDLMNRKKLHVKLIEYPGGGHGLNEVADKATEDLFAWLKEMAII